MGLPGADGDGHALSGSGAAGVGELVEAAAADGVVAREFGRVVILNGAPRSGKSSIVLAVQQTWPGGWLNLGVDRFMAMTPERWLPGIGLRPGGERPDLEPIIERLYRAMYASIAAHSRLGLNVVVDVGHHDAYSRPLRILPTCARLLADLPVWFIGVDCPVDVVMARRRATWGVPDDDGSTPEPVLRWQAAVHRPGIYDLTVDTAALSPAECAALIARHIESGAPPTACARLAAADAGPAGWG